MVEILKLISKEHCIQQLIDIENNIFNGAKWKQYLIIVDSVFCTRTRAEQEILFNKIQTFHVELKLKELYELVNRSVYRDGEFYWHTKGEYVKSPPKNF